MTYDYFLLFIVFATMKSNLHNIVADTREEYVVLRNKIRDSEKYACDFYATIINNAWSIDGLPHTMVTFREAGGLIAKIRGNGENYLDWYCCAPPCIVDEVLEDLKNVGINLVQIE